METRDLLWAQFLSHFWLWAVAAVNLMEGICTFTGDLFKIVNINPDAFYAYVGKDVIMVAAIISIVMAFVNVYTALSICHERKRAIRLVPGLDLANGVIEIILIIVIISIFGPKTVDISSIVRVIACFIFAGINWVYFNNRKNIFIN